MRCLLGGSLVALMVGCATASSPNLVGGDDDNMPIDARPSDGRLTDARVIDAMPVVDAPALQTITLNQTSSQAVEPLASVACSDNGTGFTRDNSYFRVFRLADFGVNRPFTPTSVSFGIEQATSGVGSQTVQVRLYTLNGALALANLTNVAGNNVNVPDSGISMITAPIAPQPIIPTGATLVAEVFSPDGDTVGNAFFIGANMQTETAGGFIRSDACMLSQPTSYATVGFPNVRLILTVTGTY